MTQADPAQSTVEFRVCVLNEGTPYSPLHLPCTDVADAERTRESWAKDPDPNADVWVERREISPWERVA